MNSKLLWTFISVPLLIWMPVANAQLGLTNSNPQARTIWEFMREYSGSDKVTRLMNSFSVGDIGGCSGTLISPHIFMTAAHCGGPDHATRTVRFFRINEDAAKAAENQTLSEGYSGRSFPWQSFVEGGIQIGDTMLWWLDDGSDGVAPGVKYGYVELSTAAVNVGDVAYSFWVNPLDELAIGSTLFHSVGTARELGTGATFPVNFTQYDIFAVPGASGSSVIGAGNHGHGAIGVTAIAGSDFRRCANSWFLLQSADSSANQVLDAIEYDLLITREPRNFYRLRFDTPLQRAQWRPAPGASDTIVNTGQWLGQVTSRPQTTDSLWHSTARFAANATYRISLVARAISADSSPAYVKFLSDSSGAAEYFYFQPVTAGFRRFNGRVRLEAYSDYRLLLGDGNQGSYHVESISILREDGLAGLNFETAEERQSWEYVAGSYPTAWGILGANDFSGMVVGPSPGQGWSLRNRFTGLEALQNYRITFDAMHVSGSLTTTQTLITQNLSGAVESEFTWRFTQVGQRLTHTVDVEIGPETGNVVTFGSRGAASYMVDNIRIQNIPRGNLLFPRAYLSRADSPFDLSGLGTSIYLEDFEDNSLNTPGVSVSSGTSIITGGGSTDSVDADDGTINGSGVNGHSLFSPNGIAGITFAFNAQVLGSLPTQAGIAWTDGSGSTEFEAFDATGTSLGVLGPVRIADGFFSGTTAEDRFFGVVYNGGISAIRINNTASGGIEVDHLQYGQFSACRAVVSGDRTGLAGTTHPMAYDANLDTSFKSSYNAWQYLQLDLRCEGTLSGLRRYMSQDGTNTAGARSLRGEAVTYSTDGLSWTSMLTNGTHGWEAYPNFMPNTWHSVPYGWSSWLYLNLPVRARYVRFNWEGNSDALHEVQFAVDTSAAASRLQSTGLSPAGHFQLRMSATVDETLVIQASTNLIDWLPLRTNRAVNPFIDFTDPDTRSFKQRFFRGQTINTP